MYCSLYILFLFVLNVGVSQGQEVEINNTRPVCLKEEFSCHDGTCISDSLICNGVEDCANGLDEVVCFERPLMGCPPNDRPCGSTLNCYPLISHCDGIVDCPNGEDEADCGKSPNSSCLISEFECPANASIGGLLSAVCIAKKKVCNCIIDCSDGADEENCAPYTVTKGPELFQTEFAGSTAVLMCEATGYPIPVITWLKNLRDLTVDPRFVVLTVNGSGILYIRNVSVFDEGLYSCVISQPNLRSSLARQSTNLTVIDDNEESCHDVFGAVYTSGDTYYDIQTILDDVADVAATDITFIVDESGSMERAHTWVSGVAPLLESSLKSQGVGVGDRKNLYALVGFGRPTSLGGRVLAQLSSVDVFVNASHNLATDGIIEDGYAAILFSSDNVPNRINTTKLYVLVTDEARQTLQNSHNVTREHIIKRLRELNITLNVVVAQRFLYNTSSYDSNAFGLHFNRTAFSLDPLSSVHFRTHTNGGIHPNRNLSSGTTYEDYVQLAFSLEGAAWSILVLSTLTDSTPFSRAFIQLNVDEIFLQRRCLVCICGKRCVADDSVSIENCAGFVRSIVTRILPSLDLVQKGNNVTLNCATSVNPSFLPVNWTFASDLCDGRAQCTSSLAVIDNVDFSDTGSYSCRGFYNTVFSDYSVSFIRTVATPTVNVSLLDGSFTANKYFQLKCDVTGSPTALIRWKKIVGPPVEGDYIISNEVNHSVLTFNNIQSQHSGTYECSAVNCAGVARSTFNATVVYDTCDFPDGSLVSVGEHKLLLHSSTNGADVILLVDESGSMNNEYQWIPEMAINLDNLLKENNIGITSANLFSVVGFGSTYSNNRASRILQYNGEMLVTSSLVKELTKNLFIGGKIEDGYAAVQHALDDIPFRGGAKQFILISDENRDALQPSLNQSHVLSLLMNENAVLNVAVSQSFQNHLGQRALGIDNANRSFVYNPFDTLSIYTNGKPVENSGHGTTEFDYTYLAFATGGAAWDLNLLRNGGEITKIFTNSFVLVKANEIYRQNAQCLNCSCHDFHGTQCVTLTLDKCNFTGVSQINETVSNLSMTIVPKRQVHIEGIDDANITCSVANGTSFSDIKWTFNGGLLPMGAIVTSSNGGLVSTISLSPVLKIHKGSYTCFGVGNNKTGFETALIEVMSQSLFGLEVYPTEYRIIVDSNYTIVCNTTVPTNFSWEYNYGPLPVNTEVVVFESSSLLSVIQANAYTNTGRYSCIASNILGSSSNDSLLFVEEQELQIYISDKIVDVMVGDNATLICKIECCLGAQISWKSYNGTGLPPNAIIDLLDNGYTLSLSFYNISLENCNVYVCEGEYKGTIQRVSAHLNVKDGHSGFSVSTTNISSSVSLCSGLPLYYVICDASASVQSWFWSYNETSNLTRFYNLSSTRSILVLCNLTVSQTGIYTCTALSFDGEIARASTYITILCNDTFENCSTFETCSTSVVTSSVMPTIILSSTLYSPLESIITPTISPSESQTDFLSSTFLTLTSMTVTEFSSFSLTPSASPSPTLPPLVVTISPSIDTVYIMPGESFNITCSTNVGTAVIRWVYPNSSNVAVINGSYTSQLQINMFSATTNVGEYRCIATLKGISIFRNISVADGRLVVHVEFESQSLDPGVDLNVTCTTTVPVEVLEWKYLRNENGLPNNVQSLRINSKTALLVIESFESSINNGAYRCEAMVKNGSNPVSNQVQINSKDNLSLTVSPPTIKRGLSDVSVHPMYECRVTCTCGGARVFWEGNPPYLKNTTSTDPTMRMSTLTITGSPLLGKYVFTCVIQQRTLGELRRNVTLEVLRNAEVDVYPEEIRVERGATHTFECVSSREATFRWSYGQSNTNLPMGASVNLVNMTVSQLTVVNVRKNVNTGTYNCHAAFLTGEIRIDGGNLVERETEVLAFDPQPPLNVKVDSFFTVECKLDCPCGGYSVQWVNVTQGIGLTSIQAPTKRQAFLMANRVTLIMSGNYTCEMRGPKQDDRAPYGPFIRKESFQISVMS